MSVELKILQRARKVSFFVSTLVAFYDDKCECIC